MENKMNDELEPKTVSELKAALEKAIEVLGPDARWCCNYDEGIIIAKHWPQSDPSDIYISIGN
jgi:hypothetical protein